MKLNALAIRLALRSRRVNYRAATPSDRMAHAHGHLLQAEAALRQAGQHAHADDVRAALLGLVATMTAQDGRSAA